MYVSSVAKWLARDAMDGVGRLTLTIVVGVCRLWLTFAMIHLQKLVI